MLTGIIESCSRLQPVPQSAIKAYTRQSDRLVELVNTDLEGRYDIQKLIGRNPFEVMRTNHSNHALFMSTVFRLNAFELLAKTLPWVYRAYNARGFSFDYFPVELEAWQQALDATLDTQHNTEISAVYDWMQQQHGTIVQLALADEGLPPPAVSETGELQQRFLSFLLLGDTKGCLALVTSFIQTIDDIKTFYLQIICPSMTMVGLLWERNELSVAEEHLATAIVGRVMAAIYPRIANIDTTKGKVLVTAAPNEFHEVGARMVADFLEMEGWYVDYLGASVPGYEIVAAVKRIKPLFVALSVTSAFNLEQAQQIISAIKADADISTVRILVGGIVFNSMPELWHTIGADGYAGDAGMAITVANAWLAEG